MVTKTSNLVSLRQNIMCPKGQAGNRNTRGEQGEGFVAGEPRPQLLGQLIIISRDCRPVRRWVSVPVESDIKIL